jgi:hypothetical protein
MEPRNSIEKQTTRGHKQASLWHWIGFLLLASVVLVVLDPWLSQVGSRVSYILSDETKPRLFQAYLADLNGDGPLDAFLVYFNEVNRVVLNDGNGHFTYDRGLVIYSYALALGDINADGQVEAILNNFEGQETQLLCAQSPPNFRLHSPADSFSSQVFAMRDENDDGSTESFLASCCNGSTVIYNYKTFSNESPCLGQGQANAVALADLNGDGALDAFLAKGRRGILGWEEKDTPNEVWLNNGQGNFIDSGQRLGQAVSLAVVVGDVNGDGFPDAVVGNRGPDDVWLNDGQGRFSNSGQRLGGGMTHSLFLVDLDEDGDLDLFTVGESSSRAWLNDGDGGFRSGQRIRYGWNTAVAVGDVTGDGVVDVFVAGLETYQVWRGAGNGRFTSGPEGRMKD